MKKYELLFILPGTLSEDEVDPLVTKVEEIIKAEGGDNLSIEKMEKRRLAYPMKHIRYGYFNLAYFEAEPDVAQKVNAKLKLIPELLRALMQNIEKEEEIKRTIQFGQPVQHKDDKPREERKVKKFEKKEDRKEEDKKEDTGVVVKAEEDKKEEAEEKAEPTVSTGPETTEKEEEAVEDKKVESKVESKKEDKKEVKMDDIDKKLDEILDIDLSNV